MKPLRYALEYVVVATLLTGFQMMSLDAASATAGWIARKLGPRLKAHKTARKNVQQVFPDKSEEEVAAILEKMWDNLGRTVGEFPHVNTPAMASRVTISGESITRFSHKKKSAIFVAAHFGNWELSPWVPSIFDVPVNFIYRVANNPWVDRLIQKHRLTYCHALYGKGADNAKRIAQALKNNESIGLLVDQKMNNGIAVPFFGRDAMTAPGVAVFARKFRCPVIPARVVRHQGAHFDVIISAPMEFTWTDNSEHDIAQAMRQVNALLESWITEHPEQWFWVHRRWPKEAK